MGHNNWMQVVQGPHLARVVEALGDAGDLGVALQVAFERQTLKPVFHLIGYRLWV